MVREVSQQNKKFQLKKKIDQKICSLFFVFPYPPLEFVPEFFSLSAEQFAKISF